MNVYAMHMRVVDCEVREYANIYVFVIWKSNQCYIGVLRLKKYGWTCIYICISCYDVLEVWCGFVCLEYVVVAWFEFKFCLLTFQPT